MIEVPLAMLKKRWSVLPKRILKSHRVSICSDNQLLLDNIWQELEKELEESHFSYRDEKCLLDRKVFCLGATLLVYQLDFKYAVRPFQQQRYWKEFIIQILIAQDNQLFQLLEKFLPKLNKEELEKHFPISSKRKNYSDYRDIDFLCCLCL